MNPNEKTPAPLSWQTMLKKCLARLKNNWPLKAFSLMVALFLWGGLISQDATLTREKTFNDVPISVVNRDTLRRQGLIITGGLDDLSNIRLKVEVPQKMYDAVSSANYNVRVDLGRITEPGTQKLPVLFTSSSTYGTVTSLSVNEITVEVDDYITRRRIPVQLNETGTLPAGFYGTAPNVEPATVTIAGPKSLISGITRCVADYNTSLLVAAARTQYNAVPFRLFNESNQVVSSDLIEISSDSVLLDTLLIEQTLYRLKPVNINITGATVGKAASGYRVTAVSVEPAMLNVAGSQELMETLTHLDLDAPIDIDGATETLIRSVKVKKPEGAYHMSENAVYLTVQIEKVETPLGGKRS